jgi:hypothetical protein
MKHHLYSSIEELADPETLRNLTNWQSPATCLAPFQTQGWSSTEAEFLGVNNCNGLQPRYVIKRLRRDNDWVMAATGDDHWRTITVWQQGLLDKLPREIDHGIIACTVDEDGYAILMHNVSDALLPEDKLLSEADNAFILQAMAAYHAAFWRDDALNNPALNLCTIEDFFTHTAPHKIRPLARRNPSPVLEIILEGRQFIPEHLEVDVADLVQNLVADPSPLCNALARFPQTLVHGDWRLANFGISQSEKKQLVLLDWARPVHTVPAVDLAYYLVTSSHVLPDSIEQTIEMYKQNLAVRLDGQFDESSWQAQLEISLFGVFATMACFEVWGLVHHWEDEAARQRTQKALHWWSEQARIGARWLA